MCLPKKGQFGGIVHNCLKLRLYKLESKGEDIEINYSGPTASQAIRDCMRLVSMLLTQLNKMSEGVGAHPTGVAETWRRISTLHYCGFES